MAVGVTGDLEDGIKLGEFIVQGVEVFFLSTLGKVKRNIEGVYVT